LQPGGQRKGLLVVLEGIDGAGHSAHASELASWARELPGLRERVLLTKEPTGGPVGKLIKAVLRRELDVSPWTLALLFAADRLEHVEKVVRPALEAGFIVICDRYYLSSYAYQSAAGVSLEWLKALNSRCPRPDLTIILDAPVESCLQRIREEREHLELFEEPGFLEEVRKRFLALADELRKEGQRVAVVSTDRPFEEAQEEVRRHFLDLLRGTRQPPS